MPKGTWQEHNFRLSRPPEVVPQRDGTVGLEFAEFGLTLIEPGEVLAQQHARVDLALRGIPIPKVRDIRVGAALALAGALILSFSFGALWPLGS